MTACDRCSSHLAIVPSSNGCGIQRDYLVIVSLHVCDSDRDLQDLQERPGRIKSLMQAEKESTTTMARTYPETNT